MSNLTHKKRKPTWKSHVSRRVVMGMGILPYCVLLMNLLTIHMPGPKTPFGIHHRWESCESFFSNDYETSAVFILPNKENQKLHLILQFNAFQGCWLTEWASKIGWRFLHCTKWIGNRSVMKLVMWPKYLSEDGYTIQFCKRLADVKFYNISLRQVD